MGDKRGTIETVSQPTKEVKIKWDVDGYGWYSTSIQLMNLIEGADTIPPAPMEEESTADSFYAFLTAPAPGNCSCNIPPPCKFHPK